MNFAGRFADLFRTRGDSGERHARSYLQGLLSKEPAKNMERMAEVIEGTSWQNLQQFIGDTKWDEGALWDRIGECANARLGGHRDSMLIIDGWAKGCGPQRRESRTGSTLQSHAVAAVAGEGRHQIAASPTITRG